MVTHSCSRSGSIASFHTTSGGAAMSMLVVTSLTQRGTLPTGQVFDGLPLAQRVLDRSRESVHTDAEQLHRALVARQQVGGQRAHQRADEAVVLAGDRRGDAAA